MDENFPVNRYNFSDLVEHIQKLETVPDIVTDSEMVNAVSKTGMQTSRKMEAKMHKMTLNGDNWRMQIVGEKARMASVEPPVKTFWFSSSMYRVGEAISSRFCLWESVRAGTDARPL